MDSGQRTVESVMGGGLMVPVLGVRDFEWKVVVITCDGEELKVFAPCFQGLALNTEILKVVVSEAEQYLTVRVVVTHIGSGLRIASFKRVETAMACMAELVALGVDWERLTAETAREQSGLFSRVQRVRETLGSKEIMEEITNGQWTGDSGE
jgi:hypothetical protein